MSANQPKENIKNLPRSPGVYLFKNKTGEVIYVGKARQLKQRVASYFQKSPDLKTGILLSQVNKIDYITTTSEMEALLLEAQLIKKFNPRYNIELKDDKAYPLLKLTIQEKWPRLLVVRRKEPDGALYFGPYQGAMARAILNLVKKTFPMRWCRETPLRSRTQACLYYRMGICPAPCIDKVFHAQYMRVINNLRLLLAGKISRLEQMLKKEMQTAANHADYETAAKHRDSLNLISKLFTSKEMPALLNDVADKCGQALQRELGLPFLPVRVEGFDISNLQGSNIVGSMVTFIHGAPLKSAYRKFKIKSVSGSPDDVASIYEVVLRRFKGSLIKSLPDPDLILIDGGPAQLQAAVAALRRAGKNIFLISLAKRLEDVYCTDKKSPLRLDKTSMALQYLQRVRDEAHRFAVAFHRQKRKHML